MSKQSHNNKKNQSKNNSDNNKAEKIDINKFPSTPHLFITSSNVSRDDLHLDEYDAKDFYSTNYFPYLTLEEKIDGSNIGISLDPETMKFKCQNRSHFITSQSHSQFKTLDNWLNEHSSELYTLLSLNDFQYILFGEWMYAKHSIYYDKLPDTFIAFDIFDKKMGKFLSVEKRNEMLQENCPSISIVKKIEILEGFITKDILLKYLDTLYSNYKHEESCLEGIYIRLDGKDGYLEKRCKVVRSDFIQQIEQHWSTQEVVKNQIDFSLKYQ
ncbi:hypothetical protein ABK040_003156 [Willaertia magna]